MDFPILHKSAVGLDVHNKMVVACLLTTNEETNESHHEFAQFNTFEPGLEALADWVKARGSPPVMMESTGIYWQRPRSFLVRRGIECIVVNARHVKNVPGHKTDFADSLWLAMLCRSGLVRPSFVPLPEFADYRRLSRLRTQFVETASTLKNRLSKELVQCGVLLGNVISDIHGMSGRAIVKAICQGVPPIEAAKLANHRVKASEEQIKIALGGKLTDFDISQLNGILSSLETIEGQIDAMTARLVDTIEGNHKWAFDILLTIPGVDEVSAATIIAELGVDMDQFGKADRLASWAGLCPGNNESAGKRKSCRIGKGNRWIRRNLCEVAHAAVKTKGCYYSEKFKNLSARRGRKRAIVAIAHSILRTMFYMLKRKEHYQDRLVDYRKLVVTRNSARWIKNSREFGILDAAVMAPKRKPGRPKKVKDPAVTVEATEKPKRVRAKKLAA